VKKVLAFTAIQGRLAMPAKDMKGKGEGFPGQLRMSTFRDM